MKKKFLITISLLVYNCFLNAQVLFTDNFDNYSYGYLGTDYKAQTPGQGDWFIFSLGNTHTPFSIVNETGKGKVLDITSPLSTSEDYMVFKKNLNTLINNRSSVNNVIKFEIDYYTGHKATTNTSGNATWVHILSNNDPFNSLDNLAGFAFEKTTGHIDGFSADKGIGGSYTVFDGLAENCYLPFNTWVKINIYLDYTNRKVYFDIPVLKKAFMGSFLQNSTSTNLIQDFAPNTILLRVGVTGDTGLLAYTRNKFDDIKITALNAVPTEVINNLSSNEQLSAKFNMYPNPASNVVNITNSENMAIQQVAIYDISGKQVSSQNFDSFQEIQVNVENLASGNYMLHLQTNQGTAVKKLVKK